MNKQLREEISYALQQARIMVEFAEDMNSNPKWARESVLMYIHFAIAKLNAAEELVQTVGREDK